MTQRGPLAITAALLLCACGGDSVNQGDQVIACTTELRPAIMVNVLDDATGAAASCGARLVITANNYSETVENPAGPACVDSLLLSGAVERADIYTLTVSKPGYRDAMLGPFAVLADICHVQTVTVSARLIPL